MGTFSLAKILLIFTLVLGTFLVNGAARTLKPKDDDAVVQPQTFGSLGGLIPGPGLGGSLPNPGLGGSFPSPGLGGSLPNPGFGGSFPSPGLGTGSSSFCFPGVRCAPVVPRGGSVVGGGGGGSP